MINRLALSPMHGVSPVGVTTGKAQDEHKISTMPPTADINTSMSTRPSLASSVFLRCALNLPTRTTWVVRFSHPQDNLVTTPVCLDRQSR